MAIPQSTSSIAVRDLELDCKMVTVTELSFDSLTSSCLRTISQLPSRAKTPEPLPRHFKSLNLFSSQPRLIQTLMSVPLLNRCSCMAPLPGSCGRPQSTLMRSSLLRGSHRPDQRISPQTLQLRVPAAPLSHSVETFKYSRVPPALPR